MTRTARDLNIGGIRVRAEGLTAAQGRQLGERVAALLVERLPDAAARRDLAYVKVRVETERGASVDALAARVVQSILDGL